MKLATPASSAKVIIGLLAEHPLLTAFSAFAGVAVSVAGWLLASYFRLALDAASPDTELGRATALVLVLILCRTGVSFLRRSAQLTLVSSLEQKRGTDFLARWSSAPVRDRDSYPPADLLGRIRGLEALRSALEDRALGVPIDTLMLLGATFVVFRTNPVLAALALAGTVLPAVVVGFLRTRISRSYDRCQQLQSHFDAACVDAFQGSHDLRNCRAERWCTERLVAGHRAATRERLRHLRMISIIGNTTSLLSTATSICILHFGAGLVASRALTPGQLAFAYTMAGIMLGPLENLVVSWIFFDEARVAISRCEQPFATPAPAKITQDRADIAQLRLDRVSFEYETGKPVLREVSLTVRRGEILAIVGESGAGKSTLMHLVAGLLTPTSGRIAWESPAGSVDSPPRIGAVFQGSRLFNLTVAENISLGQPGRTNEEVESAARAVGADSFIQQLPKRYATLHGPGNAQFSAGQAQRICLARAILGEPPVLLLDEATSNLDANCESAVLACLNKGKDERITILVTHRLKTSSVADIVLVLDRGEPVEIGTPQDLVRSGGKYAELWRRQTIENPDESRASA